MCKKVERFGIGGVRFGYSYKMVLKGLKYPLIITCLLILLLIYSKVDTLSVIDFVVGNMISILPSLIGFTLAGYAMLIGFGNKEFLAFLIKDNDDDNGEEEPSLFDKLNSVFAASLLTQILTLIFAFVIKYILKLELPCVFEDLYWCQILNYTVVGFLVLAFMYSLFIIVHTVINVFNFGAMHRYKIVQDIEYEENHLD